MEYKINAYEVEENPLLVSVVKVKLPNGERAMVYAAMLDADGKMTKYKKIKQGKYEVI